MKTNKKGALNLHRETLHALVGTNLEQAQGGVINSLYCSFHGCTPSLSCETCYCHTYTCP